jgi:mRNA-degrading endonuclease YafQ of YafQ-DinJ toxin-antitoxin module
MNILFSESFLRSLKKHSSLREAIRRKVDMIIQNPVSLGEPLKGNFRGYYSASVKKNFLIIFLYCNSCRKKGDEETVLCSDCLDCKNDTMKFIAIGPHDKVYKNQ